MSAVPLSSFRELNVALSYLERAGRQLGHAQEAHRRYVHKRQSLGFERGRPPQPLISLQTDFDDAMTFAIVAAHQACLGRNLLAERGLGVPKVRQAESVKALRDLDQHWDLWKGDTPARPYPNDDHWLKINAGRQWRRFTGVRPDGHMSSTNESDPDRSRVTSWNGIDIDELRSDLLTVEILVREAEIRAFEHEYVDEPTARQLTGEALWGVLRRGMPFMPHRDEVLRMPRSELLAGLQRLEGGGPEESL